MQEKHTKRSNVRVGASVDVVQKKDQATGTLTRGTVSKILTGKAYHPRGIKVMLEGGQVGRVQAFCEEGEAGAPAMHGGGA